MFPAFDCRRTNNYGALFYTRNTKDTHSDFTEAVFGSDIPMPADAQEKVQETLTRIINDGDGGMICILL